ncbi:hypothetical protein [Hespellia stercorisuis]|uniref:Uncharacterized protein n=1 Tax=Hespellia stercorisuis DSM 15480 TaxID=1121950 RepID=A0A1M6P200_9FIRM|nr:hypothetical protein [Hespellia stercorisuis]SHK01938.1 hypothetical protein SAMN02745243_01982 [Hespellia stercorisuis DSM 15480]
MKIKIIFKNELDVRPLATVMVDVEDATDSEPIRTKLIELLNNDKMWKGFGCDADIIEIECQYGEE